MSSSGPTTTLTAGSSVIRRISGCWLAGWISMARLQDFVDVVLQCLGLRAEDRLHAVAHLDHTRGAETAQTGLIHLALVGDLHTQTGDAGVDVHEILAAAERRDDLLCLAVRRDRGGGDGGGGRAGS